MRRAKTGAHCRIAAVFLAALAASISSAAASGTEPAAESIGRVEGLTDIIMAGNRPVLKSVTGDYQILHLPEGGLALAPVPVEVTPAAAVPFDIVPHARIVAGRRDIGAAWFASPTARYAHGALGDRIEAGSLKVENDAGTVLSYDLGDESVFEDLTPRLADIDGDGRDEVLAVRSYRDKGAAVALFGLRDGRLAVLAESEPIGLPNRWLNPIGAGDFDGDGRNEIAVVRTPHIGGILILYGWQGDRLVEITRKTGFSNHAIGSTVLGMSAVLDLDGDGSDEILVPDRTRTGLLAVGNVGGWLQIRWSIANRSPIVTSIVTADIDGRGGEDILYGLANGSVMLVPR